MEPKFDTGLMWFRRDLRVTDNAALCMALQACRQVHCVFVFDSQILEPLERTDRRIGFILDAVRELDASLRELSGDPGVGLIVRHGLATQEIVALARTLQARAVFAARDYEPQAQARDERVRAELAGIGVGLHTCKDHVIFENRELLTQSGTPYSVFTPYRKRWQQQLGAPVLQAHDATRCATALAPRPAAMRQAPPTLSDLGFLATDLHEPGLATGASGAQRMLRAFLDRIDTYHETRDFPSIAGPSRMGVHLRFGTASIRQLATQAMHRAAQGSEGAAVWLSELIWRDFYFQILANFPHVAERSFKSSYDAIDWETGELAQSRFRAWCQGRTGYPLVDAGMAQLNQTGYMHNRLRMVTGSFLVKDLGIDWRWGERYFASRLNDFDLAANNGGWQWVSSSGCDAQPYFRIFNPVSQSERFDNQGRFIRRYLPQLAALPDKLLHAPWTARPVDLQHAGIVLGLSYPAPIVLHDQARARTLLRYASVKHGLR